VTQRYAIIGDPVAHSRSPAMHNAAFAACGIDATYEAFRVRADGLERFAAEARRLPLAGFNVTTPLKESILTYLDEVSDEAAAIKAVNAVRVDGTRWIGDNTDGAGFVAGLADLWEWKPAGASAVIAGSGPAARAIACALRAAGAVTISCWARDAQAARAIGPPPHRPPDLFVSALPAVAELPDEILEFIGPATRIADVNYAGVRSPVPAGLGAVRGDGLAMLLHQGALSFSWWTGLPAPLPAMRRALGPVETGQSGE
jgi:shikimate dehydrogenase